MVGQLQSTKQIVRGGGNIITTSFGGKKIDQGECQHRYLYNFPVFIYTPCVAGT